MRNTLAVSPAIPLNFIAGKAMPLSIFIMFEMLIVSCPRVLKNVAAISVSATLTQLYS